MLVDKAPWVGHNAAPIFSIDVDAEGKRLVTCGQDNRTRIWNTRPMLSEAAERDKSTHFLLATLTQHVLAVNVVRFSKSGHLLATGSDDKNICIYELRPGPGRAILGSNDPPNVENWCVLTLLRGHANNVLDLAWSPDGTRLASASVDNLVIVWDVKAGRQVQALAAHHGHVKGVAWDPFNVYLASQGETDGIYIWRIGEWERPVAHVTEFVCGAPQSTFFSRLAWSPDGQYLAAANGYGKPVHLAPIVLRNSWTCDFSLAGHRSAVSVAKFCPKFLKRKGETGEDELSTVVVLGSADHKFSVWPLHAKIPMVCAKGIFSQGVMDVAWLPSGLALFACSYDGTVAMAKFDEGELGTFASDAEVQELISKLFAGNTQGKAGGSLTLDVGIAQLRMPEGAAALPVALPRASQQAALAARLGEGVPGASVATLGGAGFGVGGGAAGATAPPGTRAGGPKRLQPVPIDRATGAPLVGAPGASSAGAGAAGAGSGGAPKRLVPVQIGGAGFDGEPAAKRPATARMASAAAAAAPPAAAQPTLAGAAAGPLGAAGAGAAGAATAAAGPGAGLARAAPVLQPAAAAGSVEVELELECGDWAVEGLGECRLRLQATNGRQRDARGQRQAQLQCVVGDAPVWGERVQGDAVLLAGSCVGLQGGGGGSGGGGGGTPGGFLAVATSARELHLYSLAGRRLMPRLALSGDPAFLATDPLQRRLGGGDWGSPGGGGGGGGGAAGGWRLMCVTSDGCVLVWDIARRQLLLKADAAPLLYGQPDAALSAVRLSSAGVPVVVTSAGRAYAFDAGMQAWACVADAEAAPTVHSSTMPLPTAHSELAQIQAEAGRQTDGAAGGGRLGGRLAALAGGTRAGPEQWLHERAQLESNVAAAAALRLPAEHERWLITYVRKLVADADVMRIREVLVEVQQGALPLPLAAPGASSAAAGAWPGAGAGLGALGQGRAAAGAAGGGAGGALSPGVGDGSAVGGLHGGAGSARLLQALLKEVARSKGHERMDRLVQEFRDQLRGNALRGQQPRRSSLPLQQQQQQQSPAIAAMEVL